jgi:hypothetical protein
MFKDYDKYIKNLLTSSKQNEDWKIVLENHELMIAQIQHERLIHLLVTIFVGISMLLCTLTTIITLVPYLFYLDIPLLILFLAYIIHYRFLENTTQSWYKITVKIREKLHK